MVQVRVQVKIQVSILPVSVTKMLAKQLLNAGSHDLFRRIRLRRGHCSGLLHPEPNGKRTSIRAPSLWRAETFTPPRAQLSTSFFFFPK